MQENSHTFATGSTNRTGHAAYAPILANAPSPTLLAECLNVFITQRESLAANPVGAEEIIKFVEAFARTEGLERACELLDLAAKFRDYNIVHYEIYKELLTTSSGM